MTNQYDPTFFDPTAEGGPVINLAPDAFKEKFRDPTIDQFLGIKVEESNPEYLAKNPDGDKWQVVFYWRPVSRIIRRREDNSVVEQIRDFVRISNSPNSELRKVMSSFEKALGTTFKDNRELNNFQGMYFERQELPLWGSTYNRENNDGTSNRIPTYNRILRVVSEEEARGIVPTDPNAGRAAQPQRSQQAQEPEMTDGEVDAKLTELVGEGATHAELLGRLYSGGKVHPRVSSAVVSRTGLTRLVESGTLTEENGRYVPAMANAKRGK